MWYYFDGIANILSLSRVKDKYRVTYDSHKDNIFHVHKLDGKVLKFSESTKRLYHFDVNNRDEYQQDTMLVTSVEKNKSRFSASDYSRAESARSLQKIIGRPAYKHFVHYVHNNQSLNCPITTRNIHTARQSLALSWVD